MLNVIYMGIYIYIYICLYFSILNINTYMWYICMCDVYVDISMARGKSDNSCTICSQNGKSAWVFGEEWLFYQSFGSMIAIIYIYIYIYIHRHIYIYTRIYMYTYVHIYIYTYVQIYIYIYTNMYTYAWLDKQSLCKHFPCQTTWK